MAVVELTKSRHIVPTANGVTVYRSYRCDRADLTAGAGGWTASGLPKVGDDCTWASATWSEYCSTPAVESVNIDPRATERTVIVHIVARAMRAWA